MINVTQGILHTVEEGKGRILARLIPFLLTLLLIILIYDFRIFDGLIDQQSMDNAQLARQIIHGAGFTTKFIRPTALAQINAWNVQQHGGTASEMFPAAKYPAGTDRILPDTYNAPGYPYLLAGWFELIREKFDQTPKEIFGTRFYVPDHRIPWMNQIFVLLTGGLIFLMGLRLFDDRVAWLAMCGFFFTDLVWQFSITGLSTSVITLLLTIVLYCALEIWAIGRARFESSEAPFWPAWLWTILMAFILGLACLMRLHLLVLVIPLGVMLILIPHGSRLTFIPFVLIVGAMTAPWFLQMYKATGCYIGSDVSLLHYGADGFEGNQTWCTLTPPSYDQLFKDVAGKEYIGFNWNLTHGWEMLGVNVLVLLFFASFLHSFRQHRVRAFRWIILSMALALILSNSLGYCQPATLDSWNVLILLLPGMLLIGSAFFFIMLDRLHFELWLLHNAAAIGLLILVAVPLIGQLWGEKAKRPYPPYVPGSIRAMGYYVGGLNGDGTVSKPRIDQWITSDMPWAVAWYGDRGSVWLPDTLADFNDIYDDYNNSGLLLITPVLLSEPTMTFTSGEYKEWFPFVAGGALPPHFPLSDRAPTGTGFIEYLIFGKRTGP